MRLATRFSTADFQRYAADLTYFMPDGHPLLCQENTALVDGIGGTTWSGSLVLGALLDNNTLVTGSTFVELGCGTGVAGLATALGNGDGVIAALLTDQEVDLATDNVNRTTAAGSSIQTRCLPWGDGSEGEVLAALAELGGRTVPSSPSKFPCLVLCAEVACLVKRQDKLVATVDALAGPRTVVLVTFDDDLTSAPTAADRETSRYERQFNERMQAMGFLRAMVCAGRVRWMRDGPGASSAFLEDTTITITTTAAAPNVLDRLRFSFPSLRTPQDGPPAACTMSGAAAVLADEQHRVTCFFRPTATSVCARCHRLFFPCFNRPVGSAGCQYHMGSFVCRKHPAELRCSVNGAGDGLGYYGTGAEGYEATFWDCCGSEDPMHPGCIIAMHEVY